VVDIFDEVDEELREERMQALLKKHGGTLAAVCVLVVLAVAGWKGWIWYQAQQDMAAASRYLAAAELTRAAGVAGPDRAAAIAAFDAAAANAPRGYAVLARLREAGLKADSGDLAGASALWDQGAADGSADPLLRELASLTWCLYNADKADPDLLEHRLQPLAEPGGTWRAMAREQLALLDLRKGRAEQARTLLKSLSEDTTAPNGVRGRAGALLERMGG
jgi:hypothetical protein